MSYKEHALREFAAIGYTPLSEEQENGPDKWIQENVMALLDLFSEQGHSGSSAPFCVGYFEKLASFKPLCPLTGEDPEWGEDFDGKGSRQNKRCSHVFKRPDGTAYDIQGKVFKDPDGCCYTNFESRVDVVFPYTPKTEYVDRPQGD